MATWKKVLTEEDGNLATSDLTSTSTSRTFKLASGVAGLGFQNNDGDSLFVMVAAGDFMTTSLNGGMQILEDASGQQGCLKLFSGGATSDYLCLMANSSATADQKLFFPPALPSANQVLKVNSVSSSDVNLEWADAGSGGVTVNNQSDNRLVTCTGTTDTLNGEISLTFDGIALLNDRYLQYNPDAGDRAGEYYDGEENGLHASTANGSSGDIIKIPKTNTGTTGFLVYTIGSGGQAELLSAASSSTNIGKICFLAPQNGSSGSAATIKHYIRGMMTVRAASIGGTFGYGAPLYLDPGTSGKLTFTQPTTANTFQRRMGYGVNSILISGTSYHIIWFDPSHEYVKIT